MQYYKPFSKQREVLRKVWNTLKCVDWEQFLIDAENDVFRFLSAEPKRFIVHYTDAKGQNKHRETNEENTALNWKVRLNGEVYEDVRFAAKKRLYNYLINKLRQ